MFENFGEKLNNIFLSLQKPPLDKKVNFFRLLAVCQKAGL
jgi:hypothetical protein